MINYYDFRLIPDISMNFEEKLYTIFKILLIIGILSVLIFNDVKILLFVIMITTILYLVYIQYLTNKSIKKEKLEKENLDIIYDVKCIKPKMFNPFMNPTIIEFQNNKDIANCSIDNNKIKNSMNNYFKSNVFKDVNDIYNRNISERQFYTVPSTTIPNDQETFSKWLYKGNYDKTCKENNGIVCYNNNIM